MTEEMIKDMQYRIRLERDICRTQGSIYEKAAMDGCDMPEFSDRYLSSRFCRNRMETAYSPFQREDAETCLEFIYPEIRTGLPIQKDGPDIFSPDAAYWAGYTYYQLYCETGIHGDILKDRVPFRRLLLNYPAHHTLDEIYSTDMLCRYYGLEKDRFHTEYGEYLDSLAYGPATHG